MQTSPDFKELLKLFEKNNIRYLVVGGYAVMKSPRLSIVTLFVRFLDDRRARGALPDHGLLTFQDTVKPALCLQPKVNLMPGAGNLVGLADFT